MMPPLDLDGGAVCDRCGRQLPAYGLIHGLCVETLNDSGRAVQYIFCYTGGCRDVATAGMTQFRTGLCSVDGALLQWTPAAGVVGGDLDPANLSGVRSVGVCRDHAPAFLAVAGAR